MRKLRSRRNFWGFWGKNREFCVSELTKKNGFPKIRENKNREYKFGGKVNLFDFLINSFTVGFVGYFLEVKSDQFLNCRR